MLLMKTSRLPRIIVVALLTMLSAVSLPLYARGFNDKLLNRPYADNRAWHLGFSFGVHAQDIAFTHNGFVTPDGRTWFMDQPSLSPGFCVNGLIDLRLNSYFNVRFTPGMYFGNRDIKMVDTTLGHTESQNIKSAYVVLPVDLKYSAARWRNARPYLTAGVMPTIDVSKKRSDLLMLNTFDTYLTIGFGCDFYLPFFKFIPELKFCFGLADLIKHDRPDLVEEPDRLAITQSLRKAKSRMVVLTFYFE